MHLDESYLMPIIILSDFQFLLCQILVEREKNLGMLKTIIISTESILRKQLMQILISQFENPLIAQLYE